MATLTCREFGRCARDLKRALGDFCERCPEPPPDPSLHRWGVTPEPPRDKDGLLVADPWDYSDADNEAR